MDRAPQIKPKQEAERKLIEKATLWVEEQSRITLEKGEPLSDREIALARAVGVEHPELVRILEVDKISVPADPDLKVLAEATGLLPVKGMTFDHGIQILKGQRANWLVSHELRHVYQYEQAGSIKAFLSAYLPQLLSDGYFNAPLEIDARNHEQE